MPALPYGALPGITSDTSLAAGVWDYLAANMTTANSVGALVVAKLALITSANVTVSSPVATNLNVTTYQGDDYDSADGRQLSWTISSTATLTGGVATVIIHGVGSYTGAVTSETTVTLDLTATQTAAIPPGTYDYSVRVTQTVALGSDMITLVRGRWTSKAALSAT